MAAVLICPQDAVLRHALRSPPRLPEDLKPECAGPTFTKSLSESSSTADDRKIFGKSWSGSTHAPEDVDSQNDLVLDTSSEDDRSPWASETHSGEVSFSLGQQRDDEFETELVSASDLLPSEGSRLHAAQECKPCAWFWKPSGCLNGTECQHCHLCPKHAVTARKKERVRQKKEAARQDKQVNSEKPPSTPAAPNAAVETTTAPLQPMLAPTLTAMTFRPPPGLPPPPAPMFLQPPLNMQHLLCRHRNIGEQPAGANNEKQKVELLLQSDDESTDNGSSRLAEHSDSSESQSEVQSPLSDDLRSVGSQFHANGTCKPCAWFWRAGGCQNGSKCLHCHMCPEGEIKLRKKQRAAIARKQFGEQLTCTQGQLAAIAADQKAEHGAVAEMQLQAALMQQQLVIQQQQQQLMQMQMQLCFQKKQMQHLASQPAS